MNYNLVYKNNVIFGDANRIMKKLSANPDFKVDAIITDPPYGVSSKQKFDKQKPGYVQNFGGWDHDFNHVGWLMNADKLLKPGGSMVIFNSFRNIETILKTLRDVFGYSDKGVFNWEKSTVAPRWRDRRYVLNYEYALWMTKPGDKWTFNRQDPGLERPNFRCAPPSGKIRQHTTQKPVQLLEHLIKIHTNPGELILDPFAGSGSTGIAALKQNREFIGIEKDKDYSVIANDRINNYIKGDSNE